MIQDISPHRLDNSFRRAVPEKNSRIAKFKDGKILVAGKEESVHIPTLEELSEDLPSGICEYIFSVDDVPFFLIPEETELALRENIEYADIRELYRSKEKWAGLAGVTANHLNHWYREHRYCGFCGSTTDFSENERAKVCPECGNVQYPRISPVIMAAVTDGDRLLVTRYAGRAYKGLALIAGFVEIGESLEQALEREVMEEVGLKVKDLRYFGSQPWGFSDSVISGYFARLDGDGKVRLDRDELSEAVWLRRDEIPEQKTDISITSAMIEAFRTGEIK